MNLIHLLNTPLGLKGLNPSGIEKYRENVVIRFVYIWKINKFYGRLMVLGTEYELDRNFIWLFDSNFGIDRFSFDSKKNAHFIDSCKLSTHYSEPINP